MAKFLAPNTATFIILVALAAAASNDLCRSGSTVCADNLSELNELDTSSLLAVNVKLHKQHKGDKVAGKGDKVADTGDKVADKGSSSDNDEAHAKPIPALFKNMAESVLEKVSDEFTDENADRKPEDVAGSIAKGVAGAVAGALTNAGATEVVKALNGTLDDIQKKVDDLHKQCNSYEASLLKDISAGGKSIKSKAGALESDFKRYTGEFLSEWSSITALISASSGAITKTLKSSGDKKVAKEIKSTMHEGLKYSELIEKGLKESAGILAGAGTMAEKKIKELVESLKEALHKVEGKAKEFVKSLDKAFRKILDNVTFAIAKAVPDVNANEMRSDFEVLLSKEKTISASLLGSFNALISAVEKGIEEVIPLEVKKNGVAHAGSFAAMVIVMCVSLARM